MCKRNMRVWPIHKGGKSSHKTVPEKTQMLQLLNKYIKSNVISFLKKEILSNELKGQYEKYENDVSPNKEYYKKDKKI